jgi:hypothetical protein
MINNRKMEANQYMGNDSMKQQLKMQQDLQSQFPSPYQPMQQMYP